MQGPRAKERPKMKWKRYGRSRFQRNPKMQKLEMPEREFLVGENCERLGPDTGSRATAERMIRSLKQIYDTENTTTVEICQRKFTLNLKIIILKTE